MKKISAIIMAMLLTLTMGFTAYAEYGGTGNTGGTSGNITGNTVGTGNGVSNNYRTTATDNDMDWGWIGLLGLAGLAGLTGRNRDRNPQK
ncbi:WGxxGxxG family protein [Brevibacillus daliensis]|uniref:WGxxGxxG family protein n=1 Tax=Brevibacillus daliensis TaxID=2892995 RepID=UPI001E55F4D5|nr:WGxxGxxG family protein [Brevibacillus daliensis]